MTKRQKYFLKQKLIGLTMILAAIYVACLFNGEGVGVAVLCGLIGSILLFSKDMCWIDEYYYEVENSKKEIRGPW